MVIDAYKDSLEFARKMDKVDPLGPFRKRFKIPIRQGKDSIYLCGNSLGLQPVSASAEIASQLDTWAILAVEGHFAGPSPWLTYHRAARKPLAALAGALETEVVAMNSLTTNLHLMLATFLKPKDSRNKVLMEKGAFPSDHYAVETHLRWHGLDPAQCVVEAEPDLGLVHSANHLVSQIEEQGDRLALVLISGVHYYTGQLYDMGAITKAAHRAGAMVGFDLAHAIGNVPLQLHQWEADFAVWCSYKYLNSGPGGIGGAFVHENHHHANLGRLGGWWGHNEAERFLMKKGFEPVAGADGWQLSNPPALLMAAHMASLRIFDEAGIMALRKKSVELTTFMEFLLQNASNEPYPLQIITPANQAERGCQLSLYVEQGSKELFHAITKRGVVADWREPNVIRAAPVPLYNTFEDVYQFVEILKEELLHLSKAKHG